MSSAGCWTNSSHSRTVQKSFFIFITFDKININSRWNIAVNRLFNRLSFHLHEICVLCPAPALTALRSPWAATVGRTDLTLTFPGGVKHKVRSVKCSELPFLLF